MLTLGGSNATKVESKAGHAVIGQRPEQSIDHASVHVPAVKWVRMTENHQGSWVLGWDAELRLEGETVSGSQFDGLGASVGRHLRDASVTSVAVENAASSSNEGETAGTEVEAAGEAAGKGRSKASAKKTAGRRTSGAKSKSAGSSKLPIKMLNDRILVEIDDGDGDRKSSGGILIPATAQVGKRLTWARVVAIGPNVRSMQLDDRVLFSPEDRYEVEVGAKDYIILRERDVHAVAAERLDDSPTGLYL